MLSQLKNYIFSDMVLRLNLVQEAIKDLLFKLDQYSCFFVKLKLMMLYLEIC